MPNKPDSAAVAEAAVAFSKPGPPIDLDALDLNVNAATKDAWLGTKEAFLKAAVSQESVVASATTDLPPGSELTAAGTVVGVGISSLIDDDEFVGAPGSACVVLYSSEPIATRTAINYVVAAYNVDALEAEEARVRVVHTGPIDLLAHRFRIRPAPGGVSIGHGDVSAGTLGCLCTGRNEPRDQRLLVLSNNHVLANVNAGQAGDAVYQPGPYDGGLAPSNQIGILERFVTIDLDAPNGVDCATAWVDEDDVRRELVYLRHGQQQYFSASLPPIEARVGMNVGKTGRTTQLTAGRVTAVGVTINVNLGNGRAARFDDQIAIEGLRGDFSSPGDSGSLVWTWDQNRNPVGLLFAGGGGVTFANRIDNVLDALDINLVV